MVQDLRTAYNQFFTSEKYARFLEDLNSRFPGAIDFRVAETPVFVDRSFTQKLMDACETITDLIISPDFLDKTERAIPAEDRVPDETPFPEMIAFDFGICENDKGELEPQLIEMQGFPTLVGFQTYYPEVLQKHFPIPEGYSHYMGSYNKETFLQDLKDIILGGHPAEEVVLLEIKPHEQKTRIDFYCTREYTGIEIVCLTELIQEGRKLFYLHPRTGKKTRIARIYNRVIFDELHQKEKELGRLINLTEPLDVEWVPHPNWFFRISKFTLPLIHHPYVPATYYLDTLQSIPNNLQQYVLKPLFSFAGQGVRIDVSKEDILSIKDPENWILQKKVRYADIIQTPDVPAKAEIRIIYLWKKGWSRPKPAINLARLSKGKMIGVRYNKDKEWVGGSVCFFER
jgi:hypothetical protein